MPLNSSGLLTDLNSFFTTPPDNGADCASEWGDAMQAYTAGIIPASTTVAAAAATLESSIAALLPFNDQAWFLGVLETYFTTFATTVGTGMVGYSSVPPPGAVGFSSLADASTNTIGAINFYSKIDTWMRTGVSTLLVVPFTVVPWT